MNNIVVETNHIVADTLEEGIFKGKVGLKSTPAEDKNTYQSFVLIPKKFVSRIDQNFVVQKVSKATSFSELADVMRNFLTSEFTKETHDFIYELDRYICVELCRFMNLHFACELESITCFIDDHADIQKYLSDKHSELASDCMKGKEAWFVRTFLKCLDENIVNSCFDDIGEETSITFIENTYSITVLDIVSQELGLNLTNKTVNNGNLIIQSANPYFYQFVKELVERTNDSWNTTHILIITKDDVVYEVSKSIIGFTENFVVSYFK